jgi:hypothetical protein
VGFVAVLAVVGRARAEEPAGSDEIRLVDVTALVQGRTSHVPEHGPFPLGVDQVNDEMRPLFGAEGEEPVRAYGHVDDVIDLVKEATGPNRWEDEGRALRALGASTIGMRGPKALLDDAEAFLSTLERDAATLVVVDAVAFSGRPPSGSQDLVAALSGGDVRVLATARTSGFSGQRATARSGAVAAFLADQDVEVAEKAQIEDPIVSVVQEGLSLAVRPVVDGAAVQMEVRAWYADVAEIREREEESGQLEMPRILGSEAAAPRLRAKSGEWTVLGGSGGISFAFRATVETGAARVATPPLPRSNGRRGDRLAFRTWPLRALAAAPAHSRGPDWVRVVPSSFTAPEPPELPEPTAAVSLDTLVELVRASIDPPGWEREGALLEARNNVLLARTDDATAREVEALLKTLSESRTRSWRATATVVSLGRTSALSLLRSTEATRGTRMTDGGDGAVEARAVARVGSGGRQGTFGGQVRTYLADYEVEIAQDARIGNPVVQRFGEGLMLDVQGALSGSGDSLVCEVRADHGVLRQMRAIHTRHGDIDLPHLAVARFRGGVVVPIGGSRLLTAWTEGDEAMGLFLRVDPE